MQLTENIRLVTMGFDGVVWLIFRIGYIIFCLWCLFVCDSNCLELTNNLHIRNLICMILLYKFMFK